MSSTGKLENSFLFLVELSNVASHVLDGRNSIPLAANQTLMTFFAPWTHVGPSKVSNDLLNLHLASHIIYKLSLLILDASCSWLDRSDMGTSHGDQFGFVIVIGL